MRVSIFTPTQRTGIDVTINSLARQQTDAKIQWILSDELYHDRHELAQLLVEEHLNIDSFKMFWLQKKLGYKRNLAAGYNKAMQEARTWGADLFISLQDFIYVPEDGVQRFIDMYNDVEITDSFKGIYTGICSISADPFVEEVADINNLYSIFKVPHNERPKEIEWMDIRYRDDPAAKYHVCPEIEYETNWACVPRKALYDDRLSFDEEYDKAVAYENQDFAYLAKSLGYHSLIDMNNQVISLPHKKYYAEEWAEESPLTQINRVLCESKWS